MKGLIFLALLVCFYNYTYPQTDNKIKYKDPKVQVEERVKDLLSKMSLDEKIAQLVSVADGNPEVFSAAFLSDNSKMLAKFGIGIGFVQPFFRNIKETVESRNAIQKYLLEKTRLGVPAIFTDEGLHGLMRPEATSFPQAIGLACSWDPELFEQVYSVVADEMRSRGAHLALTPVIDVCRDPRWGRVEETYGEDPYLNGILGIAAVKGFQGSTNGTVGPNNVAATLKHLVGHGQPEGGINQAPANYSERVIREFHLPPFKAVIDKAKPVAVMPSYNEIDGIPSHTNKWLIQNVLRKEWGFTGFITSDYTGIDELLEKHFIVKDKKEAAYNAFKAGVEFEFPNGNYYLLLKDLLNEGKIKIEDIDAIVIKLLKLKFELGLFENAYVDIYQAVETAKSPAATDIALKAAHESIVLLKNEDEILPLPKNKYKKIAVIGPCANEAHLGGYSGEPYHKISLFEGIKHKVGSQTEVLFAQGCKLTTNATNSFNNWKEDEIKFPTREENLKLIAEALVIANQSEIIILAIGENEQLCREAWTKSHLGDAATTDLFGDQEQLAKEILALGKPVIVYLMNGRPLSINYIAQNASAVIEGWYMGQETGTAAADIIFGDICPSGKLTISFPKSVGQLPVYYNHKPSAQYHNYYTVDNKPLYSFGYGLSYNTYTYSKIRLSQPKMKGDEPVIVSVDVTNYGKMKGDEIVQLYIRDKVSSVTRPVIELKGFERITLNPGQTKTVQFTIDKSKLAFWDINMKYTVEPGEFEIMVGKSSEEYLKVNLVVE